ncbi:Sec-independent protein translocase subunit TatA [Cellulomonas soli]
MNALKPWHIIVLLVVIILLFGANRLPDLARSLGQSLKIFKAEVKDLTADDKPAAPPAPAAPQPPVQPGTTGTTGTDEGSGAGSGTAPQA